MTSLLDAPLAQVAAGLRDDAAYPRLDPRILAAQVLRRPASNELDLFTHIDVCFTCICRKVERAECDDSRALLSAQGGRTRVIHATRLVPKFRVPALVGRAPLLRGMRDASVSLFEHFEVRAGSAP